ncbi:MAG: hypothetical protein MI808_05740 [Pseudomonadales bacterium]|nr:hypothetical protein [Pseudomonadales bacterium]
MSKPDSIIAQIINETLNQEPAQLLVLHNGLVIALTRQSLGCFKSLNSLNDALGNGLLSHADIQPNSPIEFENGICVATHTSGYVGLLDGKALLIKPHKACLYPNNHDGLRGLNCLAELDLPPIDVH